MWQLKNLSACSFECTLSIFSELKFLWQTEQIKFSFLFGIMHFFWCILNWSVLVKLWSQYSQWRTLSVMCTLVWRLKFSLCLKIFWHVGHSKMTSGSECTVFWWFKSCLLFANLFLHVGHSWIWPWSVWIRRCLLKFDLFSIVLPQVSQVNMFLW